MDKSICKYNVGMRKLLEAINEAPYGIAFIEDDEEKLCGVVTDGDFRRLLLSGRSLDESLEKNDLTEFVYAEEGEDIHELLKKTSKRVRLIPIVNQYKKVVDYFLYDHRVKMIPVAEPNLKGNEFKYLSDAFLSTWISSTGAYINRFEKEFAAFCTTQYAVTTSNGTTALQLALATLEIGEGDEVIVPDLTFAATINVVLHAGATPVIVDVEKDSWCIDPIEIEKAITPKTRAIIPVHVYGQPCDMDAIMKIAKAHNLYVIEDAAEAHGAEYNGKKVGSFGDIGCFSFYGNKIITTGEGGMCTTNIHKLNEKMRVLRDHGMSKEKRYWHDHVGFNFRMTNLQAAIGCAQLERINDILEERKATEKQYQKILSDFSFIKWQDIIPHRQKVVWLVCATIVEKDREQVIQILKKNGIDVRPFFYPLSEMPIYKSYTFSNKNSIAISKTGINLPTIENIDFSLVAQAFNGL